MGEAVQAELYRVSNATHFDVTSLLTIASEYDLDFVLKSSKSYRGPATEKERSNNLLTMLKKFEQGWRPPRVRSRESAAR